MPLDIIKFFTPAYFFNLRPAIALNTVYFLLIIFGALIVLAIAVKIIQKTKKRKPFSVRLLNKYFSWLITMGIIGEAMVWLRYERAPILSARFWLAIWLLGFILWLIYILEYQFRVVPQAKKQLAQKQIFNRYLPRKR